MRFRYLYGILLSIAGSLTACEDIFEPDIAEEKIVLLLPAQNALVETATVTFKWEKLSGARNYNLLLASPSFDAPAVQYIDTVLMDNGFVIPLQPGSYEWRVKALNAGYGTTYTSRAFTVDPSSNLGGAEVKLESPGHDTFTNRTDLSFAWNAVDKADRYIFEIRDGLTFDTIVYSPGFVKRFPRAAANYSWRVTALNATGLAVSSTYRFMTDFESPTAPELLFPRTDTTVFDWPITLKWRWTADDAVSDSLYLYRTNRTTLVPSYPKKVQTGFYSIGPNPSLAPGEYYWAVKSTDKATNTGELSGMRKFIVR